MSSNYLTFKSIDLKKTNELHSLDESGKIFSKLIHIFHSESRNRLPEMKTCVDSENFDGLSKIIHRFRSTAYNLGANQAAEITKQIDQILEKNSVDKVVLNKLILSLESECYAAYQELLLIEAA